MPTTYSAEVSDSDLCEALLGTWRLTSYEMDVNGARLKPFGDSPQGYLVYTTDDHVFLQIATRAARVWPGPEFLGLPTAQRMAAVGVWVYCGRFEVADGQVVHKREFGILPTMSGNIEPRSVALESDRLTLGGPQGGRVEWQRVH